VRDTDTILLENIYLSSINEGLDKERLLQSISSSPNSSRKMAMLLLRKNETIPDYLIDGISKDAGEAHSFTIDLLYMKKGSVGDMSERIQKNYNIPVEISEKLLHRIARNWMLWNDLLDTLRMLHLKLPKGVLDRITIGRKNALDRMTTKV
jgi:hypothetical protein